MQVGDQLWHSACYDTIAGLKAPTQDALNAAREAGAKWMREKAEQVCELKRVALIKAGGELLAWNECAYLRDEIHDLSVKP